MGRGQNQPAESGPASLTSKDKVVDGQEVMTRKIYIETHSCELWEGKSGNKRRSCKHIHTTPQNLTKIVPTALTKKVLRFRWGPRARVAYNVITAWLFVSLGRSLCRPSSGSNAALLQSIHVDRAMGVLAALLLRAPRAFKVVETLVSFLVYGKYGKVGSVKAAIEERLSVFGDGKTNQVSSDVFNV